MVEKIIGLYGVPRSGTSWLGQIFDSCEELTFKFQPLFSYAFKNRIHPNSSRDDMEQFFDELICREDSFLDQTENREKGIYPSFQKKDICKTQLAYKEANYLYSIPLLLNSIERIKMIAIVRNPYEVMESWVNAPSEFKPEWDIFEEWEFAPKKNAFCVENFFGYYKWKEALLLFCEMEKQFPNNFKIIQYEELRENALEVVEEMYVFCGLRIGEQTRNFVKESQTSTVNSVYSVFRKKGDRPSRNMYLPNEIKAYIKEDLKSFKQSHRFGYHSMDI